MTAIVESAVVQRDSARHPLLTGQGLLGVVLVAVVVAVGLCAGVLTQADPLAQIPGANLLGPGHAHWLGTDDLNRDVFARLVYGLRIDLLIVFLAVPSGAVIGAAAGLAAGINPVGDVLAQRVFDVILAFPAIILGIALAAITGPGAQAVVVVILVAEIPIFGRQIRTAVLRVREQAFVEATEVIGAGRWWTLRRHVLPHVLEPLAVQLALSMSIAVAVDGAMSFIGLGMRPPQPSLGSLLADSISDLDVNPAMAIGPLVVIAALTLGFLSIAQALGRARRIE